MNELGGRLLRPLPAVGLATALAASALVCLVGTATGDYITLLSRVAAFMLPVTAGLVAVVIAATVTPREAWSRRRRMMLFALGAYLALLGILGAFTASSGIGVVGPPMPPTATSRL